jgi:cytochrome b561
MPQTAFESVNQSARWNSRNVEKGFGSLGIIIENRVTTKDCRIMAVRVLGVIDRQFSHKTTFLVRIASQGGSMTNNWKSTKNGYGLLNISLHWLMLALIVATYAMMDLKTLYPRGSAARETMAFWHDTLGLTVFCLVWVRIGARSVGTTPVIVPEMPAMQALLAKGMHLALYALMIGLPVLGWLTLSAKGSPVPFWGAELPPLIDKSKDTARLLKQIHETLATAGYLIIGLHASAALLHHYIKRDNTLRLMLPNS